MIAGGSLFSLCSPFAPACCLVLALQMVCFLGAALMTCRLDVVAFRKTVKTRFSDVMDMAVE